MTSLTRLAVGEAVGEQAVLRRKDRDVREDLAALVERARGVGAGALDTEQAALCIKRNGPRALCGRQVDGLVVRGVELADRVRLLLGEEDAAVGRGDEAVCGLEVGPDELPRGVGGNNAGDGGDGGGAFAGAEGLCPGSRRHGCHRQHGKESRPA